jgi:hypothetical protein
MVDVLDAERWAGIQEREDIIKELKRLMNIYECLAIRNASEASKEDKLKEEIVRQMADTKAQLMNLHKEVKDK